MNSFQPLLQQLTRLQLQETELRALQQQLDAVVDWDRFIQQAELYAISGLIAQHIETHKLAIPPAALLSFKGLTLRHRSAAQARYLVLGKILQRFNEAGIPLIALKGLALAQMIYPAQQLRPMRDMDLLVPASQLQQAASELRDLGFHLPVEQPSKYMRGTHQLPNATIEQGGFTVSVEIHHDALSRDAPGHLYYQAVAPHTQQVRWRELEFTTLGHEQMLHQVSRHLEALHPGGVLKLANVLDVVLYAEQFRNEIDWALMRSKYSHVLNSLKCLQMIVPLSPALQKEIGNVSAVQPAGVGEIMLSLTTILTSRNSWSRRLKMMLSPSAWWLHLYYNVSPDRSLLTVKLIRHPATVVSWLAKRLYSRILGG